MPSAYAYGQRFVANAPCRKIFHRLLHDSVFFRMESNDTHSSFRIKQTYVSPDRGVQPFQFPVHFDADCLKSTLRRIPEFPAVRSGYAVFDNFCQLPRRRYRRLFSFFDDVFRDVSRKSFVAVRKNDFLQFLLLFTSTLEENWIFPLNFNSHIERRIFHIRKSAFCDVDLITRHAKVGKYAVD